MPINAPDAKLLSSVISEPIIQTSQYVAIVRTMVLLQSGQQTKLQPQLPLTLGNNLVTSQYTRLPQLRDGKCIIREMYAKYQLEGENNAVSCTITIEREKEREREREREREGGREKNAGRI